MKTLLLTVLVVASLGWTSAAEQFVRARIIHQYDRISKHEDVKLSPGWTVGHLADNSPQTLSPMSSDSVFLEQKVTVSNKFKDIKRHEAVYATVSHDISDHFSHYEPVTIYFANNKPLFAPGAKCETYNVTGRILIEIEEKTNGPLIEATIHRLCNSTQLIDMTRSIQNVSFIYHLQAKSSYFEDPNYGDLFEVHDGKQTIVGRMVPKIFLNLTMEEVNEFRMYPLTMLQRNEGLKTPHVKAQIVPINSRHKFDLVQLHPGWTDELTPGVHVPQTLVPDTPISEFETQKVTVMPGWNKVENRGEGVHALARIGQMVDMVTIYFQKQGF